MDDDAVIKAASDGENGYGPGRRETRSRPANFWDALRILTDIGLVSFVPHVVEPRFLIGARVVDKSVEEQLRALGFFLPIAVDAGLFFR